jgi:hypothetical protein
MFQFGPLVSENKYCRKNSRWYHRKKSR